MKKIITMLTMMAVVLAVGTAYAEVARTMSSASDDTFLNYLDPSSFPGYVNPETGIVTPDPKDMSARGSAAGGVSMEPEDTFLNYLDPSSYPGYVNPETGIVTPDPKAMTARGSAAGGVSMEPEDTFLNYIDPRNVPGYIDPESGLVTRANPATGVDSKTWLITPSK